jgi:hypothetical protein
MSSVPGTNKPFNEKQMLLERPMTTGGQMNHPECLSSVKGQG